MLRRLRCSSSYSQRGVCLGRILWHLIVRKPARCHWTEEVRSAMAEGKPDRSGDDAIAHRAASTPRKRIIKQRVRRADLTRESAEGVAPASVPRHRAGLPSSKVFVEMPFKDGYNRIFDVVAEAAARVVLCSVAPTKTPSLCLLSATFASPSYLRNTCGCCDGGERQRLLRDRSRPLPEETRRLVYADPNSLKFDLRYHRTLVYDPRRPEALLDRLVTMFKGLVAVPSDPR